MKTLTMGWAAVAFLTCLGHAQAAPITYTFTGTGSGSLGALNFGTFTVTATADTSQVVPVTGGYGVPDVSGTVSVTTSSGVVSGSLTPPVGTLVLNHVNSTDGALSISAQSNSVSDGLQLLTIVNPALSSYDLTSSIGPLVNNGPILPGENFFPGITYPTSAGNLDFTAIQSLTFRAEVIPEPTSLTLMGLGILGVLALARHRRVRTPA